MFLDLTAIALSKQGPSKQNYIVIKAEKKLYKVDLDDIVYFNSIGDYVKVFTKQGKVIITNETLKNIETCLPANLFSRIHKSYIVSMASIRYIEGNQLMVENSSLPIGIKYKESLISKFNTQF